jgi:hypothetical protein
MPSIVETGRLPEPDPTACGFHVAIKTECLAERSQPNPSHANASEIAVMRG